MKLYAQIPDTQINSIIQNFKNCPCMENCQNGCPCEDFDCDLSLVGNDPVEGLESIGVLETTGNI